MNSLRLNTGGYEKRNKIINFILFLIIIFLFVLVLYEVLQMKNENESYEKEIKTLEKENKELNNKNEKLNKQTEKKAENIEGSFTGSLSSGKTVELLLTNTGGLVLSTYENGTNECFYGGYTLDSNKINISLLTGRNSYNGEVKPNNNIELTVNEDKSITYKETNTNMETVLVATSYENFKYIGKVFTINNA